MTLESSGMFLRLDRHVWVISLTNAPIGQGRWAAFSDIEGGLFQEFP
jgi:hypothetical protein